MEQKQYLIFDQPQGRTTSYLIGDVVIPAPSFIPEVKGDEDIETVLRHSKLIPIGNPITVPAFRWIKFMENPLFRAGDIAKGVPPISSFVKDHPLILYDPPELFRYTLTKNLISYALKGNINEAKRFYKHLKKKDYTSANAMVPPLFQPFVERQMSSIMNELEVEDNSFNERTSHLEEAWLDPRIDGSYIPYLFGIATDAQKMPNATLVPPVPPLLKSSNRTYLARIKMANEAAAFVCNTLSKSSELKPIIPYYHLYIDWNIVEPGQGNDVSVPLLMLKEGLSTGGYSGVAITINGYEEAAIARKMPQLAMFMNDIVNIAHEYHVPVITMRSKWYGLYFSDYATQGFGSLLSGANRYTRRGALKNPDDRYGKTPVIEKCVEMKFSELMQSIKEDGECPTISGLPKKPNPEWLVRGREKEFRINWSKAMRLIHIEEARRMREGKQRGDWNPAKLYLARSDDSLLKF